MQHTRTRTLLQLVGNPECKPGSATFSTLAKICICCSSGGTASLEDRHADHLSCACCCPAPCTPCPVPLLAVQSRHGDGLPRGSSPPPAATSFPKSLEELRDQLEAGTLSLDSIDIDAMAKQLLSVGGLLKLARQHSTYLLDYALMAQNMLDDAAGFAEGLYAMITAQDPLAALLFCGIFLSSAAFCYVFGVGAGVYVVICVLLRPPMLRGVPGVFGWKALLDNLPSRSVEELMA